MVVALHRREPELVRSKCDVVGIGFVIGPRRIEQRGWAQAVADVAVGAKLAGGDGALDTPLPCGGREQVKGVDYVVGICGIDAGLAAVEVRRVVKDEAVAEHVGPVVLGSADDQRIRRGMLADELELGNDRSLVDTVVPIVSAVCRLVYSTVGAGVDLQVIGGVRGERVVVHMDACADAGHGPRAAVLHALVEFEAGNIEHVRSGDVDGDV